MVGGGDGNPFCQHTYLTKQEEVKQQQQKLKKYKIWFLARKTFFFQQNETYLKSKLILTLF